MKKLLLLTCTLILIAVDVLAQSGSMAPPPSSWKRYTVKGEAFSVIMPTVPAPSTFDDYDEGRMKERRRRLIAAYAEGLVYAISCFENPAPRKSLDEFISHEVRSSAWDRASEKDVIQNGIKGKQYASTHKIGGTLQAFSTKKGIYLFEAF